MNSHISQPPPYPMAAWLPRIYISDCDSIHAIPITDIIYLEAEGSYTKIITPEKSYYSSRPLKSYEKSLNDLPFFRSHHSFVVNLNYMTRYDKACRYIELINGTKVSVSYRKKDLLLKLLRGE